MARARGCDLHTILAGALICWVVMDGVGAAQESAEATEDLGTSYVLARRTTGQGSIIETLLFAGQAIVTEIAVPSRPGVGATTGAAVAARAPAVNANAAGGNAARAPLGMGPGFSGTWLAGEMVGDYLVLHRIRATGPVVHEIFSEGHKVGSVTEVVSSGGAGRSPGRNSFAFESTDDRFVVHFTQADGTRIRSTTEHGRFSGQVVEGVATAAVPPRSVVARPPSQLLETVQPSVARASESQQLASPQEVIARIVEEPAQLNPAPPEVVPLPRAFPYPRLRPSIAAIPGQTAGPSPPGNYRRTPAPIIAEPAARSKPAIESVSAPPHAVTAARPVGAIPATTPASDARPRSVTPESAKGAPPARAKSTVAVVAARPPTTTAAKPIAPSSKTESSAAKPTKPALATANARPSQRAAAKPVTTGAKPSRPVPSGTSSQ